jgi:hypothetical protein
VTALAQDPALMRGAEDESWSVEDAEKTLFRRLDREQKVARTAKLEPVHAEEPKLGRRFTYRPAQIHWRELWMTFAAAVLLALALGITLYRTGVKRGAEVAQTIPVTPKESGGALSRSKPAMRVTNEHNWRQNSRRTQRS